MSLCAACGLPGHRYGRNEGLERFDPMVCINILRGELAVQSAAARRLLEAEEVQWCEEHRHLGLQGRERSGCTRGFDLWCESEGETDPGCRIVSNLLVDPQEGDG